MDCYRTILKVLLLITTYNGPCHLQICRLKRQNLSTVVGKLTAEVRNLAPASDVAGGHTIPF
jgi:hypothetical protein